MPDLWKLVVSTVTQCGALEGFSIIAIMYLARQLAEARKGWEADRASLMTLIKGQAESMERINVNRSQIEGIREAMGIKETKP